MGQSKMPIPKSFKLLYSTMNLNTISLALVGKANKCEIFIINSGLDNVILALKTKFKKVDSNHFHMQIFM